MTIAAAYLTSDGVVFGADSTTTYGNGPAVGQLLNHAQKIFEIGPPGQGRLAICTWGNARVGTASHRTIAAQLADKMDASTTVASAVTILSGIVAEEARAAGGKPGIGDFGYFLGGWDPATRKPSCYHLWFGTTGALESQKALGIGQFIFEGAPELFYRAFHGVDPKFLDLFASKLKADIGPRVPDIEKLISNAAVEALQKIPHCGATNMPLREAIDLVHMYVHLTIKGFKFRIGPPVVGGPIEIGFTSTDRLFRWVRHKRFDSAIFQEEVGGLYEPE